MENQPFCFPPAQAEERPDAHHRRSRAFADFSEAAVQRTPLVSKYGLPDKFGGDRQTAVRGQLIGNACPFPGLWQAIDPHGSLADRRDWPIRN